MDEETDAVQADSDDSAETVTIEVTKTPPGRILRSFTKKTDKVNKDGDDKNSTKGKRNKRKNSTISTAPQKTRQTHKKRKKSVSFTLLLQRSVRRDNVDEQCQP